MPQRTPPPRRPGAARQRLIADSSNEELVCWISARDAVEVLVAIVAARTAMTTRAAEEAARGWSPGG